MHARDRLTDAGILTVGAAAAILTFTTLRDLAEAVGITGTVFWLLPLGWLVPVTVDVAGVVATRVWLRGHASDRAVQFARILSWCCIGGSIAGNAGQHAMAAYHLVPHWTVVVIVSATPPAVLGAMVHLGHLIRRPDRADRAADRDDPEHEWTDPWERFGEDEPQTESFELPPIAQMREVDEDEQAARAGRNDDDLLAELRGLVDRTGPLTERQVRDRLHVGRARAKRLLAALDEQVAA